MNAKQFEGKLNQVQGDAKMAIGKTFKNPDLELSGAKDKMKGLAQEGLGDAQEGISKASDKLENYSASVAEKAHELKDQINQESQHALHELKTKSQEISEELKNKLY
jgi:uncharacterized protein YjbJ (UPF0337 family)